MPITVLPNPRRLPQHVVRSIVSPLEAMEKLGFDSQACLKGTGILLSQLSDHKALMSPLQELTFYRNCLELTGDPAVGLKLGEPFTPQRHGIVGYAVLSAATFRHALSVIENFGRLTFTFYTLKFGEEGDKAWFTVTGPPPIEQSLLDLFSDRDITAATVAFSELLGEKFRPLEVYLAHGDYGQGQTYIDHFGAQVHFDSAINKLVFDAALLDRDLPQADPDSSLHMQQQCQRLIARLSNQGGFVDEVRMMILGRPGRFPPLESIAEQLHMSSSTLRRRLREEGSSYRALMDEIRFGLAREYLSETQLPLEEISELLGYTEAGNFSHAFRRWAGESPRAWRQKAYSSNAEI